ncbi:hypothetical protein A4G99_06580 [Haladaptatus sp. R4]|uniref:glycosyltransferase family A protein n=1 Tax=Haladaptatus sp. R4 TaxID=1679489 RepID=UPI0007B4A53B|nr:glycosyltransferase family 2 protein [Haladaptatus sp. R4]KZN24112.1 hypothetical protein A4G99_06580 [Haladaptatus sp. R4]
MMSVEWSFLTTNYNKGDSIDTAITSLVQSLPDSSELIVVDGGSTDESLEELIHLSEKHEPVEFVVEESNLGEGREIAVQESSGEILVQHLDTDRQYEDLTEYLELYQSLREEHENLFFMTLDSIYISSRDVHEKIGGWPPLGRVEERVFVDRALRTDGVTLRLYPENKSEEIPTRDVSTLPKRMQKWSRSTRDNLRCGFSYGQIARFHHHEFSPPKALVADAIALKGLWDSRGLRNYGRKRHSWREFPSWEYGIDKNSDIVLDGPLRDEFGEIR